MEDIPRTTYSKIGIHKGIYTFFSFKCNKNIDKKIINFCTTKRLLILCSKSNNAYYKNVLF